MATVKTVTIDKNEICTLELVIYKENDQHLGYFKVTANHLSDSSDVKYSRDINQALKFYQYMSARLKLASMKRLEQRFPRKNDNVIGRA